MVGHVGPEGNWEAKHGPLGQLANEKMGVYCCVWPLPLCVVVALRVVGEASSEEEDLGGEQKKQDQL